MTKEAATPQLRVLRVIIQDRASAFERDFCDPIDWLAVISLHSPSGGVGAPVGCMRGQRTAATDRNDR